MKWRNTLILAVIALAGVAYFRFFEMKRPSTEEARRQAQNVVNFDRNKIDGIVIQNGDQKIEIRRRDNKWRLETPIKDQADGALVENLLSDLETWQKEGTIPAKDIDTDKSKLIEYGLSNPKLKLKLLGRKSCLAKTPRWKAECMCVSRIRRKHFSQRSRSRKISTKNRRSFATES